MKTKIVSNCTANSKQVKQEVNGTVILPPLVFPASGHTEKEKHTLERKEKERKRERARG